MSEDFHFDELDDPTPPAPTGEMLHRAVSRGRTIRQRRHLGVVVAAASVTAVTAGVALAVQSPHSGSTPRDGITVPLDAGSPTPHRTPPSASPQAQVRSGTSYVATGGYHHHEAPLPSPSTATNPCVAGAADATTAPTASQAPVESPSPAATPTPSACPPGGTSPSPTESPAPEPSTTATDSPSPVPSGVPLG